MYVSLTVVRYPVIFIPFALLANLILRLPLTLNRNISFYKLMGCGKKEAFDNNPDLQQWVIFACHRNESKYRYGNFVRQWLKFFRCEEFVLTLEPKEGYGKWDGTEVFPGLGKVLETDGIIAVLTRATVRLKRLGAFRKNVLPVANKVRSAEGLLFSLGIGEIPFLKQGTISIWKDINMMKKFAYQAKEHQKVIQLTDQLQWYSEQMFIRFRVISSQGTIRGVNPLANV